MSKQTGLSRAQLGWALAGAIPFLLSIALLGYALGRQVVVVFASVWPLMQVFGYTMTLKMAKGDPAHYLVKAQVLLHWMVLMLAGAILLRDGG